MTYRPKNIQESRVLLQAGLDEEYEAFFKAKLKDYDVDSLADLSEEDKKKFFNEIELEWEEGKGPTDAEKTEAAVRAASPDMQQDLSPPEDPFEGEFGTDALELDQRMDAVAAAAAKVRLPLKARLAIEEAASAVSKLSK